MDPLTNEIYTEDMYNIPEKINEEQSEEYEEEEEEEENEEQVDDDDDEEEASEDGSEVCLSLKATQRCAAPSFFANQISVSNVMQAYNRAYNGCGCDSPCGVFNWSVDL